MPPYEQQQEVLARFAEEVTPLVRREVPPTTLWGPDDPAARRASADDRPTTLLERRLNQREHSG